MKILEDVVGITVENEVITNLDEPIKIGFHHDALPVRKCVCSCVYACRDQCVYTVLHDSLPQNYTI